jgi:hypothetical protein
MKFINKYLFIILSFYGLLYGEFSTVNPSSSTHTANQWSNVNTIRFTWSAANVTNSWTLSGYKYVVDQVSDTNVTSGDSATTNTFIEQTKADGTYYIHVTTYGTDDENESVPAYTTEHFGPVKIDTTNPTLGTPSITTNANGSKTVTLTANDANGKTIYYTTDGTDINSTNGLTYSTSFTLYKDTTLKVRAKDEAGNWSTQSEQSVTVNYTGNVPVLSGVTEGAKIATNSDAGASSPVTSVTVGGNAVATYKYKFDSNSYSGFTDVGNAISLTALEEGTHTLYVVGKDTLGNAQPEADAQTLQFEVDNSAPTVSEPTADGVAHSTQSLYDDTITNIVLSATGDDNITIKYSTDGSAPATSYTAPIQISSVGTTTIKIKAIDEVGNASGIVSYSYTIDKTAPTSLTASVATKAYKDAFTVDLNATDAVTTDSSALTYYYTLNGDDPTTNDDEYEPGTPITISGSTKRLKFIAVDEAGNESDPSSTYVYTFDNTAPTALTVVPQNSSCSETEVTGTYECTQNPGVIRLSATDSQEITFKYDIDTNTPDPDNSGIETNSSMDINISFSAATQQKFQFTATDSVGNKATSSLLTFNYNADAIVATISNVNEGDTIATIDTFGATPVTQLVVTNGGSDAVKYRFRFDDSNLTNESNISISTDINTSGLNEGTHTLYLQGQSAGGDLQNPVTTLSFTIDNTQPADVNMTAGGDFNSSKTVTIQNPEDGNTTLYYTTNGSTPTTSSTSSTTDAIFTVSTTTTVKAIAVDKAGNESNVSEQTYTITAGSTALQYSAGWSLTSLPTDSNISAIPDIDQAVIVYAYEGGMWKVFSDYNASMRTAVTNAVDGGSYGAITNTQVNRGYWVYTLGAVEISVPGTDNTALDTTGMSGWNLVGSPTQVGDFAAYTLVWYYDDGIWKYAASDGSAMDNALQAVGYSKVPSIPSHQGFWILK